MRFKLDENLGTRTQHLFRKAGHDVLTVREQGLEGGADPEVFEACCAEGRCLVTLDRDFADVTRFPPRKAGGIVVVRVPRNPSLNLLESLIGQFLRMAAETSVEKQLWIVEPGRVRIHQSEESR